MNAMAATNASAGSLNIELVCDADDVDDEHVVVNWPHVASFFHAELLQVELHWMEEHVAASLFVGRPDANDKEFTVATAAV